MITIFFPASFLFLLFSSVFLTPGGALNMDIVVRRARAFFLLIWIWMKASSPLRRGLEPPLNLIRGYTTFTAWNGSRREYAYDIYIYIYLIIGLVKQHPQKERKKDSFRCNDITQNYYQFLSLFFSLSWKKKTVRETQKQTSKKDSMVRNVSWDSTTELAIRLG